MMPRELLFTLTRKDFVIEAKVGHGKGGQNKNRRKTACRITHPSSGAVGQAQDQRQYGQNQATAFRRLIDTKKFQNWHRIEIAKRVGLLKDVKERVEEQMKHVRVEGKNDCGRWVEIK